MLGILVRLIFVIMATHKTDKLDRSVIEWENYKHLDIHINMVSVVFVLPTAS